jgi:hypothetical protein
MMPPTGREIFGMIALLYVVALAILTPAVLFTPP